MLPVCGDPDDHDVAAASHVTSADRQTQATPWPSHSRWRWSKGRINYINIWNISSFRWHCKLSWRWWRGDTHIYQIVASIFRFPTWVVIAILLLQYQHFIVIVHVALPDAITMQMGVITVIYVLGQGRTGPPWRVRGTMWDLWTPKNSDF